MKFILTSFGDEVCVKSHHMNGFWKLGPHIHQFVEICCVMEGSVTLTVDKVKKTVKKGEFAVIHPFRLHQYRTSDDSKIWVGVISDRTIDSAVGQYTNNIWGEDFVFHGSDSLFNYVTSHLPPPSDEHMPIDLESPLMYNVIALYFAIMEEYVRNVPQTEIPRYGIALAKIYRYIEENFREDISIKDISTALGYSEKYISHSLSSVPNSNFRKILNQRRVTNAKANLLCSDKKIIDIAMEVGFKQERTFYRAFKEEVKMTPLAFRKKYKR